MQKITLGTTYYNCPELLSKFVKTNIDFVDELIVVDDGSPQPIQNVPTTSNKLKLYRVKKDIGFNSHGCRNLIMKESSNDWVVMIDIDRCFQEPEYAFSAIKNKKLIIKVRYLFMVHTPVWGENMHSSVNDYLIHRSHFFDAGGYDEEIVGQRWGDREFFKQLLATSGKEITMHDINLKHTRPSTASLSSKYNLLSSSNPASHQELIQQRIECPDKHKPILQFEWDRLL
jgi:glycosyltransferase involved in cell wall biosynthesis